MLHPHRIAALVLFFLLLVTGCPEQEEGGGEPTINEVWDYRGAEPCPMNPSLMGYTNLDSLQAELNRHAVLVSAFLAQEQANEDDQPPPLPFMYMLCPSTTFDLDEDAGPLVIPPSLLHHQPIINCGNITTSSAGVGGGTSHHHGGCIIRGGNTQIMIGDSIADSNNNNNNNNTATSTLFNAAANPIFTTNATIGQDSSTRTATIIPSTASKRSITIQGLTFANSREISVAILMSHPRASASSSDNATTASAIQALRHPPLQATFIDCHWLGNQGQAAILMAHVDFFAGTDSSDSDLDDSSNNNIDRIIPLVEEEEGVMFDHNIFGNRFRNRRRRRKLGRAIMDAPNSPSDTASASTGPLFHCIDCSFRDAGGLVGESATSSQFVLINSALPKARIILSSTLISKISGAAFLICALHGASLQLQNVHIRDSSASGALIQVQNQSQLHAQDLLLERNFAKASILVVRDSQALIAHSQFQQDSRFGVPISILVLSASQVTVQQSCLPILSTLTTSTTTDFVSETTPSIVVDYSSWVDYDDKTVRTAALTSIITPPSIFFNVAQTSFPCQGSIWYLDGQADCLDQGQCTGHCQSLKILDGCPLVDGGDGWNSSGVLMSSSATSTTMYASITTWATFGIIMTLLLMMQSPLREL